MRTIASQDTYITNIRSQFATDMYRQVALRGRGIGAKCPANPLTPTFLETLHEYQQSEVITQIEADSIIDYLVKTNQ